MTPLTGLSSSSNTASTSSSTAEGDIYSQIGAEAAQQRKQVEAEKNGKNLAQEIFGKSSDDLTDDQKLRLLDLQIAQMARDEKETPEERIEKFKEKLREDWLKRAFPGKDPNWKPNQYLA